MGFFRSLKESYRVGPLNVNCEKARERYLISKHFLKENVLKMTRALL